MQVSLNFRGLNRCQGFFVALRQVRASDNYKVSILIPAQGKKAIDRFFVAYYTLTQRGRGLFTDDRANWQVV